MNEYDSEATMKARRVVLELERGFDVVRDDGAYAMALAESDGLEQWGVKCRMLALGASIEQVKQMGRIADALENLVSVLPRETH